MSEGDVFKGIMRHAGITQADAAEMLGTTRVTISNLTKKSRLSEDWKLKICTVFNISKDVFTSKESPTYGINTDPSHILTAQEREALWNIINTQKELINELKTRLKDDGSDKE